MELFSVRKEFKNKLAKAGIDVMDADFIIANVLNVNVTELALIYTITTKQYKTINSKINKRLKFMPVDKIFKQTYFYGRKFKVNNKVLSPRQDSEILIQQALKLIKDNNLATLLDLCTGSGCLAITINKETNIKTMATDISKKALKIAKQNASLNNANIKFKHSDLFNKIKGKFDVIVSNPPYIETQTINTLDKEVKSYDPHLALDGGADGLNFYKQIADQAKNYLNPKGYLVLEIGYNQKLAVQKIFADYQFIDCVKDLNNLDRVMIFRSKL